MLTWHSEFILNKGQRRLDGLIVKHPESPPIPSPIAGIFRQYNAVDYKGPDESMTISNYFKALSYAYSIPDYLNDSSAVDQVTLTLVSHRFPRKLIHYLQEKFSSTSSKILEKVSNGIYYMYNYMIPVQLIVLSQLDPSEYLWLSCLSKHITAETPLVNLRQAYAPHQDNPLYQTIMDAIIRANLSEGGESLMCDALYELFADQLDQRHQEGITEGISQGISQGINQGISQSMDLILKLISDNRSSEIERVASDPVYRQLLIKEYHL